MFFLAWRNLSQNRTQFILGVGGVALALLLMLALDALLAGSEEDLVAYINQSGADVFVAQQGVKNMHMAASAITFRDMRRAGHIDGAASASPILYTTSVIEAGGVDVLSYIIGFDPDEPLGGPETVVAGTTRVNRDETNIDEAAARNQGLGLIAVEPGSDPAQVAAAIEARNDDVTALPRTDFAREERQIVRDMSVEVIYIMNTAGLLIGLVVTALTLYTSTLRKRQEYGVLKAIGARNGHLYAVVIAQAFLSLAVGSGLAIGLVWFLGRVLPLVVPGTGMVLTQAGVTRVLLASLGIGIVAALAPAWQVARLDPAQVFRG